MIKYKMFMKDLVSMIRYGIYKHLKYEMFMNDLVAIQTNSLAA